ncbi:DUF7673 family protein [Marinobacter pelagius]|uniref:DUF7673 domain-containing protein n=1 Tax=Marinobacter pelagius TaxID=379482 RepID=A0A1I4T5V1_9GAMM|nr:hypothetical protein [Marinobacter pelagius]SFM72056.1 hypothetical protein SAMN04487961_1015 [Marinobacter pelagius]
MKSEKNPAYEHGAPSSLFPSRDVSSAFHSQSASSSNQQAPESRLTWLDLHTRPANVRQAVTTLLNEAMKGTSDAKRAGLFLLSLWSPGRYPLDLNELGFFERELNYAVRHLLNFIIAGQVNIRMILTHSEMAPVMAAWGEEEA